MLKAAKYYFGIEDFSLGVDWSSVSTNMDKRSMLECRNFNLTKQRGLEKRGGVATLIAVQIANSPVNSIIQYQSPDNVDYYVAACGTGVYRWKADTAEWVALKSGMTSGAHYSFVVHQGFLYAANGSDANFKVFNTTVSQVGIAAPAAAPTCVEGAAGALNGKYTYVYAYKRSASGVMPEFIGNPSPVSSSISVVNKKITITVAGSADTQVDKIVLYRSLDIGTGDDPGVYYKVTEVANAETPDPITDNTIDDNLGAIVATDHDMPPKCKYMVLHKDRIFYVNCPSATEGGSLVMWSKVGEGEAAPALNYQYFDRGDGEEITGAASIGDYFVVFKQSKIAVLEGEFQNLFTVGGGIGCIAPFSIVRFEDKVIFLSEMGYRAFDGRNLFNISDKINSLNEDGYFSITQKNAYKSVYYPNRFQLLNILPHATLAKKFMVGHFLVPLLLTSEGAVEQVTENLVGWTEHVYDYHNFTSLAPFIDSSGITRIMAGTSNGYICHMDTGTDDEGHAISFSMMTGWYNLDTPETMWKTARWLKLLYGTDFQDTFTFAVKSNVQTHSLTLTGANAPYCGVAYCGNVYCGDAFLVEGRRINCGGHIFRFEISGNNTQSIRLYGLGLQFRPGGLR